MTFTVTEEQNFCRVFLLPLEYSSDFLGAGGRRTNFQEVDWFNPVPSGFGPDFKTWDECKAGLVEFMKMKNYYKPERTYLVLTYFGESFMFGAGLQR